jgi:hypothetical protein
MKWKIYLLAGFFLLLAGKSLQANNLLTEVKNPDLTESEQRYFDILITNKTTLRYKIVQADLSVLKGQSDVVNVSLFDNVKVSIVRFVDPLELPDHRIWKGNLSGSSEIGQAHFVVAQKMLDAHITYGAQIFIVRALSPRYHLLIEHKPGSEGGCETSIENEPPLDDDDLNPPSHHHEDDDGGNRNRNGGDPGLNLGGTAQTAGTTGECRIRVMILYSSQAATGLGAGYLAALINQVAIANTGLDNSNISFRYELGRVYRTPYNQSSNKLKTNRNRLRDKNDGDMDEAHTERERWRIDLTSFIQTGGGGISYINDNYNRAFNVTGINNFSVFTYHHEHGHNFECRHDYYVDGTANGGYHGYIDGVNGFRTIMAYRDSCRKAPVKVSCPRVNWFSGPNIFYMGFRTGRTAGGGNSGSGNDNALRHELSRVKMASHESVSNNQTVGGNYTFTADDVIHYAANDVLRYNRSVAGNKFEMQTGSIGSFRASQRVRLRKGFHARSGSSFRAYLENCSPIYTREGTEPEQEAEPALADKPSAITVYPNPFSGRTTVSFELKERATVRTYLTNHLGSKLNQVQQAGTYEAGNHKLSIDASQLPSGMYLLVVEIDGKRYTKPVNLIR